MQQPDRLANANTSPAAPQASGPRPLPSLDWLPEVRRYLMMRPVVFGGVLVLLVLHLVAPGAFDLATLLLLSCLYLLVIGSGGLEAARLSGAGGDQRRQERLAEDALRRAGRLQSHLEPCTATDDVVHRILASGEDPRRMAILAGNEVEDALRAVYRHFSEADRMAGTSNGTDLPLPFMVQELIWRGLLSPDIYDTAEPILSLREMAMAPRAAITPQIASDVARATQAVVLRVQSLGIEIRPQRRPLTWLRDESEPVMQAEPEAEPEQVIPSYPHSESPVPLDDVQAGEDGQIVDGDRLEIGVIREVKEPVAREIGRREARHRPPAPDSPES